MFAKLFFVSIYAILSFSYIVRAARIPTFKCMQIGWDICNIRQVEITPADRMVEDRSCFVDQGSNITISFNFTPRFEAYNLKWSIWVETVIGDYKLDGVPPDARYLTNHPTIENKLNTFQSVVNIPEKTRAKLWVVRVTMTGDTDKDVCCFLCEIRVRIPQTTTVSSTDFDPTNPYDIIRKNTSYPSIWDFNKIVQNFQNDPEIFNKFILNNAATTPKPSYFSIMKNAVKKFFGFKSETQATSKVPFLGNASSVIEYFSGIINQQSQSNEQTKRNEGEVSSVPTESECTSTREIITEDSTTEITTISSTSTSTVTETTLNEEVYTKVTSVADIEPAFSAPADEENEAGSDEDREDEDSIDQTTTSTVETTHPHTKRRTRHRISPVSRKRIAKSGLKVSRPGIKRTVKSITKSTA